MKTPKHLWIVGILYLLWSAMGVMDFIMTHTNNQAWLKDFPEELIAFYQGFPIWVDVIWGISISGGLLGALLVLMRKSSAVPVLLLATIAYVLATAHNYGIAAGFEIAGGTGTLIFTAAIFVVSLGMYFYAKAMRAAGVLR
jgi:hypothetical protein